MAQAAQRAKGTIIQFGSGKPGEDHSAAFEQTLFEELSLPDPSILFIPFHPLGPEPNDFSRFLDIYGPVTGGPIELLELVPSEKQPDIPKVERKLIAAKIVVLGSGMVEPYVAALRASGLPRLLHELHRRGTCFFGYSAGALALGEEFRWYGLGRDLLELLDEVLRSVLANEPLEVAVPLFCQIFEPSVPQEQLYALLLRRRDEGAEAIEDDPLLHRFHTMHSTPGLRLVPGVTSYPHFGDPEQCSLEALKMLRAQHPEVLHIGVPNATALVTAFGRSGPRMQARGSHPRHKVTWIDTSGTMHTCVDRQEIPLPTARPADPPSRPRAGSV